MASNDLLQQCHVEKDDELAIASLRWASLKVLLLEAFKKHCQKTTRKGQPITRRFGWSGLPVSLVIVEARANLTATQSDPIPLVGAF